MFCGECGTQNPDTNQFCKNCGKPLARHQPAGQQGTPAGAQPAPVLVPPGVSPAAPSPVPTMPGAPATAVLPRRVRNWLGILSILVGILSWVVLTGILAIAAILLGIAGTILFRKSAGRIGISGIIGMILGIAAIGLNLALA